MSENTDRPKSDDVTQIRKAVSSLSWEDRKYVIVEALRTFSVDESIGPTSSNKVREDVAFEALREWDRRQSDYLDLDDLFRRLGLRSSRDVTETARLVIVWGVVLGFLLITVAFVASIALELKGVTQLGTAFTTLLGAIAGFFAGRREGEVASMAPPTRDNYRRDPSR
jgi:hypothetical protein